MNNVKECSVVFTTEEVNAVLAGDKTQHRVIIENTEATQCLFNGDWRYDGRDFLDNDGCIPDPKGAHYIERLNQNGLPTEDYRCIGHCPFGAIGDRLVAKEPYYGSFNNEHIAAYSRSVLLEITDIRIERVRDIDAASAEVEGCFNFSGYERLKPRPLSAFITYWIAKHGDDAWFTNPWVWVIDFKVIENSEVNTNAK